MKQKERRYKRSYFRELVQFHVEGDWLRDHALDISPGGLAIATSRDFEIDQTIKMLVPLEHPVTGGRRMCLVHARTAWTGLGRVGFEFVEPSPDLRRQIDEHLTPPGDGDSLEPAEQ